MKLIISRKKLLELLNDADEAIRWTKDKENTKGWSAGFLLGYSKAYLQVKNDLNEILYGEGYEK